MYFNKIRHPGNFAFPSGANPASGTLQWPDGACRLKIDPIGADVHRLTIAHHRWQPHGSQVELAATLSGESFHRIEFEPTGRLAVIEQATGRSVLRGAAGGTFGICGQAWLFQFHYDPEMRFYGLGEHGSALEKSGQRVKCWHTDLFGDFPTDEVRHGQPNPMYAAMPWLIVKQGNRYVGLLVNHPGAVFMDLASNFLWDQRNSDDRDRRSFYLGAPDGQPELYVLVGPTLPELIRKFQTLVGPTPLPPLWALGYHQCRWGYAGPRDLQKLDTLFRRHHIPCDGLWLDIDYMERYKVFTFDRKLWGSTAKTRQAIEALARRGRRVVPILDPGVKVERGYSVYADGLRRDIFCRNPGGRPFVGFVWPGGTHFPDFSLPEVREWWAQYVRQFASTGVAGAWLDMNDPAVGAVEPEDMLFARGTRPHESYHNQYALGMARASHAGFLAARPDARPFLLTRSATFSTSRYAAMWTGDNVSNWHHLRATIPLTLGLALSGVPFNGPDVGGFFDDTTPELATAWFKAGFLFPFFRNHSEHSTRPQEPWALGTAAQKIITHYIRLRYKLLPYLYQLFVAQSETGEAILRPLFYDFADTTKLALGRISDQFMVGPSLLQAPIVEEGATTRDVTLPASTRWFAVHEGRWIDGGQVAKTRAVDLATPLYVREGALIPMQPGERTSPRNDLANIEVHCFLRRDTPGPQTLHYVCDDGESLAYGRGERTRFMLIAAAQPDGTLVITIRDTQLGYRAVRVRLVIYAPFTRVVLRRGEKSTPLALSRHRWHVCGRSLAARRTRAFVVGARR